MKLCSVNECFQPVFGKGFCRNHQHLRTDKDQRTMQQRSYDKAVEQKKKGVKTIDDFIGEEKSKMDKWFEMVATFIKANPYCWNCGEFIPEKYYRAASAHILPKAIFQSVANHPFNFLVLGAGCGCHNETHRLDTFSKMKVWNKAVERFKLFESQVLEKHKHLDSFIEYAKTRTL